MPPSSLVTLRALSKESSLLKFSSRVEARICYRIFGDGSCANRHGFVLTHSFFDSGLLDGQPFIISEGF